MSDPCAWDTQLFGLEVKRHKWCQAWSWAPQLHQKCRRLLIQASRGTGCSADSFLDTPTYHCSLWRGVHRFMLRSTDLLLPWDDAIGFHNEDRLMDHHQQNLPKKKKKSCFIPQSKLSMVSMAFLLVSDEWAKNWNHTALRQRALLDFWGTIPAGAGRCLGDGSRFFWASYHVLHGEWHFLLPSVQGVGRPPCSQHLSCVPLMHTLASQCKGQDITAITWQVTYLYSMAQFPASFHFCP